MSFNSSILLLVLSVFLKVIPYTIDSQRFLEILVDISAEKTGDQKSCRDLEIPRDIPGDSYRIHRDPQGRSEAGPIWSHPWPSRKISELPQHFIEVLPRLCRPYFSFLSHGSLDIPRDTWTFWRSVKIPADLWRFARIAWDGDPWRSQEIPPEIPLEIPRGGDLEMSRDETNPQRFPDPQRQRSLKISRDSSLKVSRDIERKWYPWKFAEIPRDLQR